MAISVVAYFYHFFSKEVGTLSGQFLQSDLYDLRYLDCGGTIWLYWGAQVGPNHINISCENMTFTSSYFSAGQLSPVSLYSGGSVCMLSCFSCARLFATPWTVAYQAPLSLGFSRQEYWSGLPCPSPGDLPNPGIEAGSLVSLALAGRFFTTSATWQAHTME